MQAVDLSALGAQALAQVEKARKAVAEQLAAAMNQKPKLDLTLELDAPKIAIPVPATEDGKGISQSLIALDRLCAVVGPHSEHNAPSSRYMATCCVLSDL